VLEWNLAADPEYNPHSDDGGCTTCMCALTIGDSISRNVSYYIIAHASKFVKPGSIRVASTIPQDLHNDCFVNSSGKNVMIVANENTIEKKFIVKSDGKIFVASLPAQSVGTLAWQGSGN
jgi:glucosylceramidase